MGGSSTFRTGGYDWRYKEDVAKRSAKSYAADDDRVFTGSYTGGFTYPLGFDINSDSEIPMVLMVDVTGSMKHLPKFILERVPTMYHECNAVIQGYDPQELEETDYTEVPQELEISIIAIGDSRVDQYPLQVVDFKKDQELAKEMNKIFPEGGGGGQGMESYGLAAYYLLNHCETPKSVIKPLCIIAGDETFYDRVRRRDIKRIIGDDVDQDISAYDVFKELAEKFNVYMFCPELGSYSKQDYKMFREKWKEVFPPEKVREMTHPEGIVNLMILASGDATDNYEEAVKMLERREEKWEIDEALRDMHPELYEIPQEKT